eukprot:scaffold1615_cov103-Isochrysis_galbana.AAC.6
MEYAPSCRPCCAPGPDGEDVPSAHNGSPARFIMPTWALAVPKGKCSTCRLTCDACPLRRTGPPDRSGAAWQALAPDARTPRRSPPGGMPCPSRPRSLPPSCAPLRGVAPPIRASARPSRRRAGCARRAWQQGSMCQS